MKPVRRHAALSLTFGLALACGRVNASEFEYRMINLLSAVTIATADGSPLSGAWS